MTTISTKSGRQTRTAHRTAHRTASTAHRTASQGATANGSAREPGRLTPLHLSVAEALEGYFETLDGAPAGGLYDLVMNEVERPLLEAVMGRVEDNQTRAAELLGLSRGTLHTTLKQNRLLGR